MGFLIKINDFHSGYLRQKKQKNMTRSYKDTWLSPKIQAMDTVGSQEQTRTRDYNICNVHELVTNVGTQNFSPRKSCA